jgi:hypothetical protein
MGQTLIKNYIHIVFGTKNQQNFINDEIGLTYLPI